MKKILLFILFFLFSTKSILATTITAIPPRLELSGNPGDILTAQLKVRNESSTQQTYDISVEDFIVADSKGTPISVNITNSRWSLKKWVTAPSLVPVDAGGTQIVNLSITIPKAALPGGHFAMVLYSPSDKLSPGDMKKTASAINQRVGTILYLTVKGKVTESAQITKFAIPKFNEYGPVEIEGLIESISDVHINPKGEIQIYDPLNIKVATLPVEVGNIFPDTTREFKSKWEQKWGWGRYRANLSLTYGTNKNLNASVFFWLFPIRLLFYTLVAIISVLVVIILLHRKSVRHQLELEVEVRKLKKELDQMIK